MAQYSVNSANDQLMIRYTAKQVIDLVGIPEDSIVRISSTEYNVIKNGQLKLVEAIDSYWANIFATFEAMKDCPKYPYTVTVEDRNEVNHE